MFIYLDFNYFLSGNVNNQPANLEEPQNQNPPQEEEQILQLKPIERLPPGTQENIINEIERGKTKLEGLIGWLKESRLTNPMRAQLALSLESIKT